jgi:cytochrome P450
LPSFLRDPLGFIEGCAEYGDVVYSDVANIESYLIAHPEDIQQVLVRDHDKYQKAEFGQGRMEPVFGNGLVNSEGEFWKRQRELIQPAFYPQQLETYADAMVSFAADASDDWESGTPLRIDEEMKAITLRILVRSLFGRDVAAADDIGAAFEAVAAKFESRQQWVPAWVPTPTNRRYRSGLAFLEDAIEEMVEDRRRDPGDHDDLLTTLVTATDDEGHGMTDEQLRDEMMTLLTAGHETTALALTYSFYLLAQNPAAREELHAELDARLGDRDPTMADLPKLVYTETVVREAMRLYPPVYSTPREPTKAVEIGGYSIPAGATLFLSQWTTHRDPRWYDDPEAFRPDRWTPEMEADLPEYAYFPFGGGPRVCIGKRFALMEAQLVLATVARRVSFDLPPDESLSLSLGVALQPEGGLRMTPRRRE